MNKQMQVVFEKLRIARRLSRDLRQAHGANVVAIGVTGSVARGTAENYSDIDLLIVLRKAIPDSYQAEIIERTYCSLTFTTKKVIRELTRPDPELPEKLGGFTKIFKIFDTDDFLGQLQATAAHVPKDVFRKSAELALLYSYEDFCRVINAYLNGDDIVLRDNVTNVTHSAALVVASLNRAPFASDREIFKSYAHFSKLPRHFDRIQDLRYGHLNRRELTKTLLRFYVDLVDFCANEGIQLPVNRNSLEDLAL